MGICYNIIYNTSTSAFEKHGSVSLTTGIHDCGFYVDNDPTKNALLNTSADSVYGTTSANSDLADAITLGEEQTSGTPNISATNIEVIKMKVTIKIKPITPVILTDYTPLPKVLPTGIVKR